MDIFDFTGAHRLPRILFLAAIIAVVLCDLFIWRP